ncbi:MAG: S-adenosylmethionine tRNA ribosyltransferase [Bacteroidetes bacterium GWA2_32_17]|nr:MAG: S-adenosylmethionine tRNA ribosyltransferase [Bacteroidetes bacterium GWA2_32_17]
MINIDPRNILASEFDYELPQEKIAKFPLNKRNLSKLLVYKNKKICEDVFSNIANYIPDNYLLVLNDTKVINARLEFYKDSGARIEIFCIEPHNPSEYSISFSQTKKCQWKCLVGNIKKWKNNFLSKKINLQNVEITLNAKLISNEKEFQIIEFEWNYHINFSEIIEKYGEIPIPPYLNRKPVASDKIRYQTVYSKIDGSVAAPTAGLHFTDNEFVELNKKNVSIDYLTLHVGAGTFIPLKNVKLGEHQMHTEHFQISLQLIKNLIKFYPKIIAVGTTSVRTLESLYYIGILLENNRKLEQISVNQWDAYNNKLKTEPLFALKSIKNYMLFNNLNELNASTSIMISPGYNFKFVLGLITNFHQPKSTLLALVTAMVGNNWKEIYDYALNNNFRFLSYGDSSILFSACP